MTYTSLFDKLDEYLGYKKNTSNTHLFVKPREDVCCEDEMNWMICDINSWIVCNKCAKVIQTSEEQGDSDYLKGGSVKTFFPYSSKFNHIRRIHIWTNTPYNEGELNRMFRSIDNIKELGTDIKRVAKILLRDYYITDKIVTRNNVRRGLFCYCVYRAYLFYKKDIDIDSLFKIFNITFKNYNNAVKKLSLKKLFYPERLKEYLTKLDMDINKNFVIEKYSLLLEKNVNRNKRTIILSLLHFIIAKKEKKTDFFTKFPISKITLKKVEDYIINNKII
jgi:hypothetical protein